MSSSNNIVAFPPQGLPNTIESQAEIAKAVGVSTIELRLLFSNHPMEQGPIIIATLETKMSDQDGLRATGSYQVDAVSYVKGPTGLYELMPVIVDHCMEKVVRQNLLAACLVGRIAVLKEASPHANITLTRIYETTENFQTSENFPLQTLERLAEGFPRGEPTPTPLHQYRRSQAAMHEPNGQL